MNTMDQRYYYTDPKYELEINLHNIRRELIFLLESCTNITKCSDNCICCKQSDQPCKSDKSCKSDQSCKSDKSHASVKNEEAVTNDSGRTSPSSVSCSNLKSPSPSALPAPIWENSSEKVKKDGWTNSLSRPKTLTLNTIKHPQVSSRRSLDFLKNLPESVRNDQDLSKDSSIISSESFRKNQDTKSCNKSQSSHIAPEPSRMNYFLENCSPKIPESSKKNVETKPVKDTAVDAFFKWFKPGTDHHIFDATNLASILGDDD